MPSHSFIVRLPIGIQFSFFPGGGLNPVPHGFRFFFRKKPCIRPGLFQEQSAAGHLFQPDFDRSRPVPEGAD